MQIRMPAAKIICEQLGKMRRETIYCDTGNEVGELILRTNAAI
jgi:hypothetical protein